MLHTNRREVIEFIYTPNPMCNALSLPDLCEEPQERVQKDIEEGGAKDRTHKIDHEVGLACKLTARLCKLDPENL